MGRWDHRDFRERPDPGERLATRCSDIRRFQRAPVLERSSRRVHRDRWCRRLVGAGTDFHRCPQHDGIEFLHGFDQQRGGVRERSPGLENSNARASGRTRGEHRDHTVGGRRRQQCDSHVDRPDVRDRHRDRLRDSERPACQWWIVLEHVGVDHRGRVDVDVDGSHADHHRTRREHRLFVPSSCSHHGWTRRVEHSRGCVRLRDSAGADESHRHDDFEHRADTLVDRADSHHQWFRGADHPRLQNRSEFRQRHHVEHHHAEHRLDDGLVRRRWGAERREPVVTRRRGHGELARCLRHRDLRVGGHGERASKSVGARYR
ncbi:unannotated protein [freshwater metagenome]|uniref:Unannotated protein n=1 Tax=freshwater metagenome TaxID=449393 RepID=A0A6J6FT03_9ZZZZ